MCTSGICKGRAVISLLVAVVLIGCFSASALTDPVPRILFVGDSWTTFMLAFKSFRSVFAEDPELVRWVEVGNRTAEAGGRVWEMLERPYLSIVTEELMRYPNVDVVVITLGGNDLLRGLKGGNPSNPTQKVSIKDCFNRPEFSGDPDACLQNLADELEEQIGIVVDHILSVRPDIRVAILSYDYAARAPRSGDNFTIEQQHNAFVAADLGKYAVALARDRVEYVNNYGLMQYIYGVPEAEPPIAPGVAPYPCDTPDTGTCAFWPGGYPQYLAPLESYIDQDIHLTAEGYRHVAQRAVDMFIGEWLSYPKALEIKPLQNKAIYQFDVTFSHPVNGVDLSDFEVFIKDKVGLKAMDVINVVQADAEGIVYTVTVDMDGSEQVAYIRVLDDDSITRKDTGVALGGPGAGNGFFEYNGLYEFQDMIAAADDDFRGALNYLYMASQAYEHMLGEFGFSFNPDLLDANGDLLKDGSLSDPYVIPGNGMLDLWEFMVIDAILKRPNLDLSATGGVTHAAIKHAWEEQIASIQEALGGIGGLADIIFPGMDTMLAGFQMLGDKDSNFLVTTLVMLLGDIEEFPTNMNPGALLSYDPVEPDLEVFPKHWLASNGDADGDGWNNLKEYVYFAPDGLTAYINAVLDPAAQPNLGGGSYEEGDFVRIGMFDRCKYNSTFQWYKDGVLLVDEPGKITGTNARALNLHSVGPEDAGAYTCEYIQPKTQGVYPSAVYGPIQVTVTEEREMPATGGLGLAILLALGTVGGTAVLRKKQK